jgi:hypothetical protein
MTELQINVVKSIFCGLLYVFNMYLTIHQQDDRQTVTLTWTWTQELPY